MFTVACVALAFTLLLAFFAGVCVGSREDATHGLSLVCLILAGIPGTFGGVMLFNSARGEISYPWQKSTEPIYSFCGHAQTSRGAVVIVENGEQDVFALWDSYENGPEGLPPEAKFVRIAKDEKGTPRLEPVIAP